MNPTNNDYWVATKMFIITAVVITRTTPVVAVVARLIIAAAEVARAVVMAMMIKLMGSWNTSRGRGHDNGVMAM